MLDSMMMMMNKTLYHDGHFFFSPSASLLSLATNQIGFVTRSILREKNVYIWPSIHWWIAPIVSTISAIWTPRCQRLAWHVVCKLLKRVRTSSLPSLIGSLRYSPKLAVNKYQLLSIYSFSYVPSLVVQLERECCFLAVQDSSIGDLVTESLSQSLSHLLISATSQ